MKTRKTTGDAAMTTVRRCVTQLTACAVLLAALPAAAAAQRRAPDASALALLTAVRTGDAAQIRALAAGGVDVNAPIDGNLTPLILAISTDQPASVEALLDLGARIPPGYSAAALEGMTQGLKHGAEILGMLAASGTAAAGAAAGPEMARAPPAAPIPTAAGRHPAGLYTGPCAAEYDGPTRVVTNCGYAGCPRVTLPGVHWLRTRRTLLFRGPVPAFPATAVVECTNDGRDCTPSTDDPAWLWATVPLAGARHVIEPGRQCEVRVPAGRYTVVIEEIYLERTLRADESVLGGRLVEDRKVIRADRSRHEGIEFTETGSRPPR
jgi:hypothetical protein